MHPNPPQTDLKRHESAPRAHAFFHFGAHFTETGFCLRDRIWMELGRIVDDLVEEDVCVDNKNHKAALS